METALLLSSSPNTSVSEKSDKVSGQVLPRPTGASRSLEKPRARKQCDVGAALAAAKRLPQRGPGVAMLERIRIQEHFRDIAAGIDGGRRQLDLHRHSPRQIRSAPPSSPPLPAALYDNNNQQRPWNHVASGSAVPRYGVPGRGNYLSPPPRHASSSLLPLDYKPRYIHLFTSPVKRAAPYGGTPPSEDARSSTTPEQHRMIDFFPTTAGVASGDTGLLRSSLGVAFQEGVPSSRARQWNTPNNNDVVKTKSIFDDAPTRNNTHLVDYFARNAFDFSGAVHQEEPECYILHEERSNAKPMKEFEFFPTRSGATSSAYNAHAPAISPDDAPATYTPVDPSLKL